MLSKELDQYLLKRTHPLSFSLKKLLHDTVNESEPHHMLSGPQVSALLRFLIRIKKPQFVLDLGTYTGFSALSMMEVLPETSTLITCENLPEHALIAKKNFKLHPQGHRIELFEGSVIDCLSSLKNPIDLVFLDADKKDIVVYYEKLIDQLNIEGILIIDDALWKGHVVSPTRQREKKMDELNKRIFEDPRVENILLPIRNGINMLIKIL